MPSEKIVRSTAWEFNRRLNRQTRLFDYQPSVEFVRHGELCR